ncbi:MAG: hypothetical protein AVDCRST_MAG77-4301 [uncultured Chloroflexi bacterium]|uniref:Uncharacterized protein n=1 Tax=uncultured Chloroflexota bacterium TaxID=166587 RepID=A0A6J4JK74_9CHLR|nr:MAG: hypothetical protein AVDCRST_MAG77-4301 [uncultured Chloroflexota bacterium]
MAGQMAEGAALPAEGDAAGIAGAIPVHERRRSWRERLDEYVSPSDWRFLAILAAVIVVSLALRVLTWDLVADGPRGRFVKVALFAGATVVVIWFLVRLQTARGSWVPLASALVVLLAGDAIHYVRLANPITRGAPIREVAGSFADESARRSWEMEMSGGGQVRFDGPAAVLTSPPSAVAYLRARLQPVPDIATQWWLPVGLAERPRVEQLAWRATVQRTQPYYVVVDVPTLLIQAVGYGIHITYPDERNQLRGHEVQHPVGADGQAHDWRIVRDSRQIAVSIDGRQVWAAPQRGELNQVRLGETKNDREHGGSMRVESVSYRVTLER